jgi:hypothetical protein
MMLTLDSPRSRDVKIKRPGEGESAGELDADFTSFSALSV